MLTRSRNDGSDLRIPSSVSYFNVVIGVIVRYHCTKCVSNYKIHTTTVSDNINDGLLPLLCQTNNYVAVENTVV